MIETPPADSAAATPQPPAEAAPGSGGDTIRDLLRRSVRRSPTAVALRFEDRTWTYSELESAVHRTAHRLSAAGIRPGDRVASFGANSDAFVVLFLACTSMGAVHVPVNFALKGEELRHILRDSGAGLVVADPALLELADDAAADLTRERSGDPLSVWPMLPVDGRAEASVLETSADDQGDDSAPSIELTSEDLAQLLYTSGTTSAPKGAMMSHRALVAEYLSAIIALDFTADDRPLIAMPLYHSAALHVFLMPYLALGAPIRLIAKPEIPVMLELVEREHLSSLFLAPTVWVPLSSHPELETRDLSSLTKAQYGASIMPSTVLQRLRDRFPKLGFYNCFGQSELGPLCTVLRPEEHDMRPRSCGRPVFHVEARVMSADGSPARAGEPGEIQYRSPQLMSGYWGRPEQTADSFVDGWFRSGDQVTRDSMGFIEVVDRIKDVINTGGVLVAPREIEDCLYRLPEVAEVAVLGVPDERWGEAITAVIVVHPGQELTAETVRQHARERLADFKVPKRVEFVAELPRNQSGKLLKRELRAERTDTEAGTAQAPAEGGR